MRISAHLSQEHPVEKAYGSVRPKMELAEIAGSAAVYLMIGFFALWATLLGDQLRRD